jgi:hypothetical protein
MPRWMMLFAAAVGVWLALSIFGGLLLGRLIDVAVRRRRSA